VQLKLWEKYLISSWGQTLKQSTRSVVVAQPDKSHPNKTASVLKWHDRHRAYNIWLKSRRNIKKE